MIDLRKPLDGAPGLLLLAALVLFGVTIGIALALGFSLVKMNDSVANFLGGVVGAGLGAALAVSGAVYVQRNERKQALTPTLNRLRRSVGGLVLGLGFLHDYIKELEWEALTDASVQRGIEKLCDKVERLVSELPEAAELPSSVYVTVDILKKHLPTLIGRVRRYLNSRAADDGEQSRRRDTLASELYGVWDTAGELERSIVSL